MSTRSLTVMTDNGEEVAVLYRQMDGYPTGHGQELVDFLKQFPNPLVGDGLGSYYDREGKKCWWCKSEKKEDERIIANGAGCLFAQLVAHFKTTAGGFYLMPAGTRGRDTEYTYYVDVQGDMEIGDGSEDIYLIVAKSEGEEETFSTPMGRRTMEGWPERIIWEGSLEEYDSKSLEEEGWGAESFSADTLTPWGEPDKWTFDPDEEGATGDDYHQCVRCNTTGNKDSIMYIGTASWDGDFCVPCYLKMKEMGVWAKYPITEPKDWDYSWNPYLGAESFSAEKKTGEKLAPYYEYLKNHKGRYTRQQWKMDAGYTWDMAAESLWDDCEECGNSFDMYVKCDECGLCEECHLHLPTFLCSAESFGANGEIIRDPVAEDVAEGFGWGWSIEPEEYREGQTGGETVGHGYPRHEPGFTGKTPSELLKQYNNIPYEICLTPQEADRLCGEAQKKGVKIEIGDMGDMWEGDTNPLKTCIITEGNEAFIRSYAYNRWRDWDNNIASLRFENRPMDAESFSAPKIKTWSLISCRGCSRNVFYCEKCDEWYCEDCDENHEKEYHRLHPAFSAEVGMCKTCGEHEESGYCDSCDSCYGICECDDCDCYTCKGAESFSADYEVEMVECDDPSCDEKISHDESFGYGGLNYCEECYDSMLMDERQDLSLDETDCVSCGYSIHPADVRQGLDEDGLCENCGVSNAESFKDWADGELGTHGKNVSFDKWVQEEYEDEPAHRHPNGQLSFIRWSKDEMNEKHYNAESGKLPYYKDRQGGPFWEDGIFIFNHPYDDTAECSVEGEWEDHEWELEAQPKKPGHINKVGWAHSMGMQTYNMVCQICRLHEGDFMAYRMTSKCESCNSMNLKTSYDDEAESDFETIITTCLDCGTTKTESREAEEESFSAECSCGSHTQNQVRCMRCNAVMCDECVTFPWLEGDKDASDVCCKKCFGE